MKKQLPAALAVLFTTQLALAHGGAPQVKYIRFPPQAGGAAWLMDELGLLAQVPEGFAWLCDDSVSALVGFEIVAPIDATTWVLSTRAGVFRTEDRGCSYTQVPGVLTEHVTAGLSPHPDRPLELVTATATLGIPNDVFRTVDGGLTWQAAGLESSTRIRSFVRSEADPQVLYASHGAGASRSDDGGARFAPIALGPDPALLPDPTPVRPEEFRFLATSPVTPLEVVAVIERFPKSFLVHSYDGGASWQHTFSLEDSPDGLVFTNDGTGLLMSTPFLGLFRSTDGGRQWVSVPAPGIIGCLARNPATGHIWACGRGRPLPWVAASTPDLGESWAVALAQYADLAAGWECPEGSPTALACARQCPPADPACMPPDGGVTDGGVADGGLDGGVDGGRDAGPDGGPGAAESAQPNTGGGSDGGCASGGPPAGGGWLALALGALLMNRGRRRRF
jgi:hypothetical protein